VFKIIHKGNYGKQIRKLLKNMEVIAGLPKGSGSYPDGKTVIEVGATNEFGTENIPARSFIRTPIQNSKKDIFKLVAIQSKKMYELKSTPDASLELVGTLMENKMKESFVDNDWQENSQSTIKKKGSSTPLIDSGQLRQAITHEVRKK